MALKYQQRSDPIGSGNLFVYANIAAFGRAYGDGPVEQTFSNGTATIPSSDSDFIFADSGTSRIGLVSKDKIEWIAGVFGATGYKDGPGNQALFAMWLAGYPVVAAVLASPTVGYVSDSGNNAIRKLEKQPDETWNVSTIYRGAVSVLTVDSLGNLWFPDGANLNRIASDGTKSSVPAIRQRTDTGFMNIWSMCADKVGNVYWHDNINAASIFYKCGQDMVIHHVCGIDQAEMNQLSDAGLPEFQDGDKDHCSFHHDNVSGVSDDGTELYMGGGDEQFLRRFKDGQSATLAADGYWHQFGLRSSADPGKLIIFYPANVDPITKSILATMPPWTTMDIWGAFKVYDLIESTDVPFEIRSAEFTDWKNVVLPFKMVAGQTYQFTIAFANGGDLPWTKAGGWRCVAADNPFGVPDQQLDEGESVLPGQIRRWTLPVTPNVAPGKYLFRFSMADDKNNIYGYSPGNYQIFATQADLDASNQPSPNPGGTMNSSFVSQNVPASMIAGQNYDVSVTFTNTGTETWSEATEYRAGVQQPSPDSRLFGPNRLLLDAGVTVAPGAQGVFKGTLTAPNAGNYSLQFQMVKEFVAWFGAMTPAVSVAVASPAPPPPSTVTIPVGTYTFTGTLTSSDGTTNGTVSMTVTVANPQPVPGTVTLTFTKL